MRKLLIRVLDPSFICGIVFISIIFAFLVIYCWRNRSFLAYLFFYYFSICAIFIIVTQFVDFIHVRQDALDDYIPLGMKVADAIRGGVFNFVAEWGRLVSDKLLAYTFWVGVLFAFFENSLIAASALSSIFGGLTVYMLYHISKDLFGVKTAKLCALLLVLSPYFIFLSVSILRDTAVVFFISWYFRLWLLHDRTPLLKYKLLMLFSLCYAGLLRPAIMLIMVVASMTYIVIARRKRKQNLNVRALSLYIKMVAIIAMIGLGVLVLGKSIDLKSMITSRITEGLKYADLDEINKRAQSSSSAGSSYYPDLKYSGPSDIIKTVPLMTLYFLCAPFPWQIEKISQGMAFMDSAALWVIYFLFLLEARSFWRNNRKWAVILFTYLILGITATSIMQANLGAATRHRVMFTLFMVPFAAHRIVTWWHRKKLRAAYGGLRYAPLVPSSKNF